MRKAKGKTPNNLGKIRTELGITQEELAGMLGVTAQAVQLWEAGKRKLTYERVRQIAETLSRAGHPKPGIWEFFEDGPTPHTERENVLLETFRNLSEKDQQTYLDMAKLLAKRNEK